MCGIIGMVGSHDQAVMRDMLLRIRHRGPDALGIHYNENEESIWGHCRLSIMDPQGGDQPLYNEDENIKIVTNGEIYNSDALRKALENNHKFKTKSDAECALHLYEEYGEDFLTMIDGMYALALSDGKNFLVARDPVGIKPLYYAYGDNDEIFFSSEAKSLSKYTEKIEEFPPGFSFSNNEGFKKFYTLPKMEVRHENPETQISELRETLISSVKKRLMSDVPLGCFLSGGLDSSIITAVVAGNTDLPLHTFSTGFENSSDIYNARKVSKYLKTIHHEYIVTEKDIRDSLKNIIYYLESFDQDLVRSAIPTYFTAKLASEEVKVILTGEGADELFAGYSYYADISDKDAFLEEELRRSVSNLHNLNLQRVDRLTMAHSIEGRVPFLDLDMIRLAQKIPVELKLKGDPPVEKWILRKAFEDMLPEEIVWRKKEQFDEGSGIADYMPELADKLMSDSEYNDFQKNNDTHYIRSREEAVYFKIFHEVFSRAERVEKTVARWSERPDY